MKSKRGFLFSALAGAALLLPACSKTPEPPGAEANSAGPESRVKHGAQGEIIVTVDAETQKTMGLQVAALAVASLPPEVKGYGQVVDPAPLAGMLLELGKAQLLFDNSHQELERMKVLKADNNTSERAFQAAEASYRQNLADMSAIWFNIQKNYGGRIAEQIGPLVVPPGTERKPERLLYDIADARNVFLVRVDVPASETFKFAPAGARIADLGEGALPIRAEFFGAVPAVDSQTQMRGYFFLVATNQPGLTPGMSVTVFMQTEEAAQPGVTVPRDAVLRFNGKTWIYLQTGDNTFQRTEVALERPLEDGWFVREGLKPQDRVVTIGAQQLLSEELKGQGGEE